MVFSEITSWLLELLQAHPLLGLIIGVLMEEVVAPIPSPLIIMTAGSILIPGDLTFVSAIGRIILIIVLPASFFSVIGSYLAYGIAYFGGRPVITRFSKYLGVSWEDIEAIRNKLKKGGREKWMIVFFRALPIMPLSLVSISAGLLKMDFKTYSIYSFLGMLPRTFFLAVIGWQLRTTFERLATYIDNIGTVVAAFIILTVAAYIAAHKFGIIDMLRRRFLT